MFVYIDENACQRVDSVVGHGQRTYNAAEYEMQGLDYGLNKNFRVLFKARFNQKELRPD